MIKVHRSRWRVMVLWVWCTLQMGLVWQYGAGSLRVFLLLATVLATAWAWWQPAHIDALQLRDAGSAMVRMNDVEYVAHLRAGSLHGWRCALLCWQLENGHTHWQCLLPDSLHGDDWRHLTLWLQFGQKE